jgi:hypothetical protein
MVEENLFQPFGNKVIILIIDSHRRRGEGVRVRG